MAKKKFIQAITLTINTGIQKGSRVFFSDSNKIFAPKGIIQSLACIIYA